MADNTTLNSGSGGDVMRTLDDGSTKWPASVAAYATTVSPGANVLQFVDASHGLPVAVVGDVTLAIGTTVGVTGTVSTSVTGSVTVSQGTASNLNVLASQGGSWTVAATQSGSWTVSVSGSVTVVQSTAANLKATVDIASGQTVGLAAGTALVGKTSAGVDGSAVYDGTTALTPKFAKIDASSSGDNAIVAAVSGKKIRVLRWGLTAADEVTVKWRSATTDKTGPRLLAKYASAGGAYCPTGIFETAAGDALNLNLSAAKTVGGELTYVEV